MNYNESTRQRIADISLGLHVQTPVAGLVAGNFGIGTQTELFNIVGRIAVAQLFIELTAAADANATLLGFNVTFSTPVIAINDMTAASASFASVGAGGRIVYVGGAVATAPILTDSAGLTDVEMAAKKAILGGVAADGTSMVGTVGMESTVAAQAATITANAHMFYFPMAPGSYVESAL